MQVELKRLIAQTEADKARYEKRERDYKLELEVKEFELKRWEQADSEFKLDCVRKNQVIENMQEAFR